MVNLRKFPAHLASSTLMLSDWTHLLFILSIRGHPNELNPYHEWMCSVTNISFVAKCGDNFHKFTHIHSLFICYKNDLSWRNNPFMVRFQLISMSLMLRTNYRCVQSTNISLDVAKWGKFSHIHPVHSLFIRHKKWLILNKQSIHGKVSTH